MFGRSFAGLALATGMVGAMSCGEPKREPPPAVADAGPPEPAERVVRVLRGHAIWYGADWQGKRTASGERFNRHALTAAHRTLPLGTRVRVTDLRSGRQIIVRINDRGPYGADRRRVIDLSEAAARQLGFADRGWTRVKLEVLERAADVEEAAAVKVVESAVAAAVEAARSLEGATSIPPTR
jgi:rare lipoprotein A